MMNIVDKCKNETFEPVALLKIYLLQFKYKDGSGWAIVNATSVKQAERVFKTQTKYKESTVISTKELRYFGNNMQIVFEGAVTTEPEL